MRVENKAEDRKSSGDSKHCFRAWSRNDNCDFPWVPAERPLGSLIPLLLHPHVGSLIVGFSPPPSPHMIQLSDFSSSILSHLTHIRCIFSGFFHPRHTRITPRLEVFNVHGSKHQKVAEAFRPPPPRYPYQVMHAHFSSPTDAHHAVFRVFDPSPPPHQHELVLWGFWSTNKHHITSDICKF